MKQYILLALICSYGLLHAGCAPQESIQSSKSWLERLAELERELRFDRDRNEPLMFADLPGKPVDAQREAILRQLLQQMELLADRHKSARTPEERELANRRLRNLQFDIPAQIEKDDLRKIADYFVLHPILDPCILQIEVKDENTLQITVGVVRGPLAGGGKTYVARRENGKWIVRLDGHWIS